MTDAGPSVALLFDDTDLVEQLREALHECGARIVHEGGVASLNRQLLQEVDADVLVINLDDAAADALDSLYALIDADRPRIVFNDAAASAALTGWDRARWARHLAVKIFQMGDIDPPRPADARSVEVSAVEPEYLSSVAQNDDQPMVADASSSAVAAQVAGDDAERARRSLVETEALSAELEALLASAQLMDSEASGATDDAAMLAPDGSVLAFMDGQPDGSIELAPTVPVDGLDNLLDDLPTDDEPLTEDAGVGVVAAPDGDTDLALDAPVNGLDNLLDDLPTGDEPLTEDAGVDVVAALDGDTDLALDVPANGMDTLLEDRPTGDEPPVDSTLGADAADAQPDADIDLSAAAPAVGLDNLLDVLPMGDEPLRSAAVTDRSGSLALPSVPADWALVDDDVITPATFGVEKQTAADFLAPDAESMAAEDEPVLNLELVSMEEAVAPRPPRAAVEMHLDELQMALSRLVLTGATLGGVGAAKAFYAALPATTQLTFLHTQHLRGQSVVSLVAQLANACSLKVTLATSDVATQPGEVLVVPPGHTVRIHRDARVELQACADELQEPLIDDSFKMAAETFGRDALAIVFSGHSNDSVAGAKSIHAGGGRVWVETAAHEYADMVHEISAAQIVEYSGTPTEMAAHLVEKSA